MKIENTENKKLKTISFDNNSSIIIWPKAKLKTIKEIDENKDKIFSDPIVGFEEFYKLAKKMPISEAMLKTSLKECIKVN